MTQNINFILFGIYFMIVLGVFAFIAIFVRHIRDFQKYSKLLTGFLRLYISLIVIIAILWGYLILTGKSASMFQWKRQIQKLDL